MEYKRLSECADFSNKRTSHITFENYISTENMLPEKGGISIASSLPDVKSACKYEKNDILLSNIRPYFKKIWFANREGSCSNDVLVIKSKKGYDSKFIYYVLSDNNFFNYDTVTSKGTKMPRGTPRAIMKYLVPDIDIETQKRIADVLSHYDQLIDNNNKRIKILEQMAENLYKEWFVRFRFPGHEDVEFEGGIPKGWKRIKLKEVYDTSSGGTPSREHDEYYSNGDIPWIKTGEMQDCILIRTEEYITNEGLKHSSAKIIDKDSVLIAMYGVNIGKLAYSTMEATCNQACCVFKDKSKDSTKHYLFQYLKSIREYLLLIGFGAAQQNLSQDLIKNIRILLPDKEVIKAFEKNVEPLYLETISILHKNRVLIKQRDLLLPRLMSGRLEVK